MKKVKVGNLVKFCTLVLLSDGPKCGYELMKELEKKLERKISASNVYPFLELLSKNKLIKFREVEKRDKKEYHLTNEGKKFVKKMFNRFDDLIDIAIKPRLSVCAHCGCKIFEGGHKEKINRKKLMFCCCHCAKSYKSGK